MKYSREIANFVRKEAVALPGHSQKRIQWVARYIIPAEPQVRASLKASGAALDEIDDLIQDAYCKFAALASVEQVDNPAAYFMQMVKNLRRDRLRRDKVIQFEEFTENSAPFVNTDGTNLEAEIGARHELRMVDAVLESLPPRCRTIFTLKRIEGLSQKQVALKLGVTETIVENDVRKAVRALQAALRSDHDEEEDTISIAADRQEGSKKYGQRGFTMGGADRRARW